MIAPTRTPGTSTGERVADAAPVSTGTALVLSGDLLFSSGLISALRASGYQARQLPGVATLAAVGAVSAPLIVLLDLTMKGAPADWVGPVRQQFPSAKIVAFGPHVQLDRLEQAASAGCDLVVSRGKLHGQLPEILRSLTQ